MSPGTTAEVRTGHDRSRRIADAVRVLAAASIVFSAFRLGLPETLGLTVMFLGLLIPRIARLAGPFGKTLPARSIVVLVFALGVTVAVLWEFIEWAGNAYITKAIHVGYNDTIGDLAVGGLGALLAGVALAGWKARQKLPKHHHRSDRL